jgi:hypothetical protein
MAHDEGYSILGKPHRATGRENTDRTDGDDAPTDHEG